MPAALVTHLSKSLDPAACYQPVWPDGIAPVSFDAARHAQPARALLNEAYAAGGGEVLDFAPWWTALQADPEFRPELCFAVIDRKTGELAGFAQCWSLGFIKDIAVSPRHRRRGLGRALMLEIFRRFQLLGLSPIDLKVMTDNPSGALGFYRGLGMTPVID